MNFDDPENNDNSIPLKTAQTQIKKSPSKDNLLTSPLIGNEVSRPPPFQLNPKIPQMSTSEKMKNYIFRKVQKCKRLVKSTGEVMPSNYISNRVDNTKFNFGRESGVRSNRSDLPAHFSVQRVQEFLELVLPAVGDQSAVPHFEGRLLDHLLRTHRDYFGAFPDQGALGSLQDFAEGQRVQQREVYQTQWCG